MVTTEYHKNGLFIKLKWRKTFKIVEKTFEKQFFSNVIFRILLFKKAPNEAWPSKIIHNFLTRSLV